MKPKLRECPVCNGTGQTTLKDHNYLRKQYLIMMKAGHNEAIYQAINALDTLHGKYPKITKEDCAHCVIDECIAALKKLKKK